MKAVALADALADALAEEPDPAGGGGEAGGGGLGLGLACAAAAAAAAAAAPPCRSARSPAGRPGVSVQGQTVTTWQSRWEPRASPASWRYLLAQRKPPLGTGPRAAAIRQAAAARLAWIPPSARTRQAATARQSPGGSGRASQEQGADEGGGQDTHKHGRHPVAVSWLVCSG